MASFSNFVYTYHAPSLTSQQSCLRRGAVFCVSDTLCTALGWLLHVSCGTSGQTSGSCGLRLEAGPSFLV